MCGRFARYQPLEAWIEALDTEVDPALFESLPACDTGPRYNIAPGTRAWVAALDARGEPILEQKEWVFPTSRGNRINVRSETAHRVPEYRDPYHHHRCVVLANGFYEPKGLKSEKHRPWYYFRPKDESPLFLGAIAGAAGFAILTRAPVPPVAPIHDRSPVMVPANDVLAWLDPQVSGGEAMQYFAPAVFDGNLEGWRVGDGAKKVGSEGPTLIKRWPDAS